MVSGVLADHVDDRCVGAPGVVQVRQSVGQSRTQVQQGAGRLARHPAVAVGSAGDHAFEQAQHRPHAGFLIQRGNEVHLRGTGIGEADLHA